MSSHDVASPEKLVVVIGAGPAGLTAAAELAAHRVPVTVLEREDQIGGLARTASYRGFWFDVGGHRFFTKVERVRRLWTATLGDDLQVRSRLSRILYQGRFFDYPLKAGNAVATLGLLESARVAASYLRIRLSPIEPEASLEDWLTNRFGRRLFGRFFRSYTEKVWGVPCAEISADWAGQRIRGLSLQSALLDMVALRRKGRTPIRALTDEFFYPRLGPGMMWSALRSRAEAGGGQIQLGCEVTRVRHDGRAVTSVQARTGAGRANFEVTELLSSMPIGALVQALDPPPPPDVVSAARSLRHRDFLTVAVIVEVPEVFPDNWLYVHDESVRVGRIQNFKNWSPDMVPDPARTCLGLEYFCFEGDELWSSGDDELVELARRELELLGLVSPGKVIDGVVVRMRKAYPMYSRGYLGALEIARAYLSRFTNLQLIGRNGMHRYNNMDHSMLTALLAAGNVLGERHDLWSVNTDEEYQEEAPFKSRAVVKS